MEAVAREAGVGKGTVFRRFGSRTGLMLALLDHSESEIQQAYLSGPEPLGPGAPPLDRLLAYGRARLKLTADHLDILLEAGAGRVIGIDRDPEALARARAWAGDYGPRLELRAGRFGDLDRIEAADYDVFSTRHRVSAARKSAIAAAIGGEPQVY